MGGHGIFDSSFATVEIYDTRNDKWIKSEDMPTSRSTILNYPVMDGKIYIIGGVGAGGFLSDVWEYTPEGLQSVVSSQGKLPTKWGNIKSR
jgi:hypothetical protein